MDAGLDAGVVLVSSHSGVVLVSSHSGEDFSGECRTLCHFAALFL